MHFKIAHQSSGDSQIVHAEHLRPAHPEVAWDEHNTEIRPPLPVKYGTTEKEPERIQPLRQAKLTLPVTVPSVWNNRPSVEPINEPIASTSDSGGVQVSKCGNCP